MARNVRAGAAGVVVAVLFTAQALAVPQGIPMQNYDFELPGPVGTKTIAFDAAGVPIAGIIPSWTFPGPGVENFGHETMFGDSGTEGGGNPGQELILSVHDGLAYQVASGFTIQAINANEIYKFSMDVHDIFTINAGGNSIADASQLTVRYTYGAARNTLATQVINPTGDWARFEFTIPHNSPLLSQPGVIGSSIGIEFDTTSIDFNPLVSKSWVGVDNLVMEIAPVMPGDFNGNGAVNATDYGILRDNIQRGSCSGVTGCPFEANGELTGDRIVDLNDFRAFKNIFSSGSGAGAGTGTGITPEPSTGLLMLLGMAACGLFQRRRASSFTFGRSLLAGVVALVALAQTAPTAKAVVLAYDPFLIGANPALGHYTVGYLDPTAAAGGGQNPTIGIPPTPSFFNGGWHRRTNGDAPRGAVQNTSLSYFGTDSLGGSAYVDRVNPGPEGAVSEDARLGRSLLDPWTAATAATYYVSWVANFGALQPGVTDMGYRGLEFYEEATLPDSGDQDFSVEYNQFFSHLGDIQRNPSTGRLALRTPGSSQIIENSPLSFNQDGGTHLVVFKFELTAENNMDAVSVFLDPVTTNEPELAGARIEGINVTVGTIGFAMYGSGGSIGLGVDELRISTTFAEALPPGLPCPGDTDGNCIVDAVDFNTILANFGRTGVTAGPSEGDVALHSGTIGIDGRVSLGDFWLWKREFEAVNGAGSADAFFIPAAPEPSTAVLMLLSSVSLGLLRRRGR